MKFVKTVKSNMGNYEETMNLTETEFEKVVKDCKEEAKFQMQYSKKAYPTITLTAVDGSYFKQFIQEEKNEEFTKNRSHGNWGKMG